MRRFLIVIYCFVLGICTANAQTPKYVFYFIGDGMGVNQVLGTEMYLAELEGKIGVNPLLFSQFPYVSMATTYSVVNGVTDSAASGTALATGHKTKNGTIGMLQDHCTSVNSIAVWAKESGKRVGIATSVSVDHATPAAFYAHQPSRKNSYEIGKDLYQAGFDFYAGSDFLEPTKDGEPCLYDLADSSGYVIAYGYDEYKMLSKKADRLILFQNKEASKMDKTAIPYAIDQKEEDLSLEEITHAAIDFLTKDNKDGFFLMVEGGKIDWACHSNDAATMFKEVLSFENSVRIAYEFYQKYPDETLIVVTADHSTGGLSLGSGSYDLNLQILKNQAMSEVMFSNKLNELCKGTQITWQHVCKALTECFGFWDTVEIDVDTENKLKDIFETSLKTGTGSVERSEYSQTALMAAEAKRILNAHALISWSSGGHSAGLVPVCAVGVGAENFSKRTDNAEIPLKIATVANYRIR